MTIHVLNLLCFFLLGSSAWILVNAIYAEIPLIVASLDNDYSVISKLTLCITLTSIAPILWSLLVDVITKINARIITHIGIGLILMIGTATSLSLSLTDAALQQTTLLVVSVASGLVGSMSRVLYFPHAATTNVVARIHNNDETIPEETQANTAVKQTTAMASGMAGASLFVAVLAIIQQLNSSEEEGAESSNRRRFSLQAYFGIVTGIFGLAIFGFMGTLFPVKKAEHDTHQVSTEDHTSDEEAGDNGRRENNNHYGSIEISDKLLRKRSTGVSATKSPRKSTTGLLEETTDPHPSSTTTPPFASSLEIQDDPEPHDDENEDDHDLHDHHHYDPFAFWKSFVIVTRRHVTINAGQFLLNTLTFFLPGIVPYSVQHFGDSQRALHYLTVTQLIAQTLGTILSGWKQNRSVWMQLLVFSVLWIPTVTLSFVNNTDFQQSNQMHSAVPITLNALLNLAYGYSSTTFYHLVHADAAAAENGSVAGNSDGSDENHGHQDDAHIASRILGSWNQLGAMTGSLIAYFLVQHGAIS